MEQLRERNILKYLGDDILELQSQLSRLYLIFEFLKKWDALSFEDDLGKISEAIKEIRLVFLQTFILKLIQFLEYTPAQSNQKSYISFLRRVERIYSDTLERTEQSMQVLPLLEDLLPDESNVLKNWVRLETFRYSHQNYEEEQKVLIKQLLEIILTHQLLEPFMHLKRLRNKWIAHAEKEYTSFNGEGINLALMSNILERIRCHMECVLSKLIDEKVSFKELQRQAMDSAYHLWQHFSDPIKKDLP